MGQTDGQTDGRQAITLCFYYTRPAKKRDPGVNITKYNV